MDIDILEIVDNRYRGLSERSLGNIQLKYKSRKWREKRKESAKIYEMYSKYIEDMYVKEYENTFQLFQELYPYYLFLRSYDYPCEMIVCNEEPLKDFYGKEIEFLGIDIVNQFCETLLYYHKERGFPNVLNKNGLCCDMSGCDKIIEFSPQIKVPIPETDKWKCLYIYKILC